MNAFQWYEEETGESPLAEIAKQVTTTAQTATESDKARAWLAGLDISGMNNEESFTAEFFKYDVSVYCGDTPIGGRRFYLSTKSPQQKQWRRSMPTQWARSANPADLSAGLERFLREREAVQNRHIERRDAKRKARAEFVNPYKVGDFLEGSWGYDQTNVDFFQVLEVRPMALKIRKVYNRETESTGRDQGRCVPVADSFHPRYEAVWVTIQVYGRGHREHSIPSPIHGGLSKWDGRPMYYSSYA